MAITQTLEKTHTNPMCDLSIKRLFGNPYIISILAKETLPIYSPYTVQEIRDHFVLDEINIGGIEVDQDEVLKLDTEDKSINEGSIYYDVLTILKRPDLETMGLYLNIEGQKDLNPGYDLINRALYYIARLFSRQKEKIWSHSDYDSLMKVVSIWICYDPSRSYRSKMFRIHLNCDMEVGTLGIEEDIIDKLEIIMIQIGEDAHEQDNKILSFLQDLLSDQLSVKDKVKMFEEDYGIIDNELNERVTGMCNMSEGYFNAGYNKGKDSTILQLIQNLIHTTNLSISEAMDALCIPEDKRAYYSVKCKELS